jgi:hypothetical protein
MQRRRQLDVRTAYVAGELQPLFDCNIGIGIPSLPWRQFLQGCRQQAQLHDLGVKLLCRHAARHLLLSEYFAYPCAEL